MRKEDFNKLINPKKNQVFFFECSAFIPVNFASHPWFVLNKKGELSRWEVLYENEWCPTSWGHLHLNASEPHEGVGIFPYYNKVRWKPALKGVVEGETAERMIEFIENSRRNYPYCKRYSLTGPNSNTYAQMIIGNFPEAGFKLSPMAFGKKFK